MRKLQESTQPLPRFSEMKIEEIEPTIHRLLSSHRQKLQGLLQQKNFTWQNLLAPLELMDNTLNNTWAPISHLNAVCSTQALRKAYQNALEQITEYEIELGQNIALYQAVKSVREDEAFHDLHFSQKKIVENLLRGFHLAGVDLPDAKKARYKEIDTQLTKLMTTFENNLVDATDNWFKHITDQDLLSGIPAMALCVAAKEAQKRQLEGYVFTLEFPSYHAIMAYADNRSLRQEIYTAYTTRASQEGPLAHQFDNTQLIEDILNLRHQLARLLHFKNYTALSLATKMAQEPREVLNFLNSLIKRSLPKARQEFKALEEFARTHQVEKLEAWDIAYFSEKLKQAKYSFSEEEVRAYFPENQVLQGLFTLTERLFKVTVQEVDHVDVWDKNVRFFQLIDENGALRGQFYLDLYARAKKRGGAWVADCYARCQLDNNDIQTPTAFITCNFSGPSNNTPALFTHEEVITLFHEFGHGLHHMLTLVDYPSISGTNGVEWDAVELPSQFMENWCWEKEVLDMLSSHYQSGLKIAEPLYQKMLAAKNFQSAMAMTRQLEFSLFDFRLHTEYNFAAGAQTQKILDEVRKEAGVAPTPPFNRFQNSFTHIFGGGYAAGYYSYKWAEVLSSDAYSKFEETQLFDEAVGKSFLHNILEMGGSKDAMTLFIAFRGRAPSIDALLRHSGLS